MKELLRTNDVTILAYVDAILTSENIVHFVFDENISVLEGSIGLFPRRVMVGEGDFDRAERALAEHDVDITRV